jgi:hypothetical protein
MYVYTQITFILPQGPQPSIAIVRGGGLKSLRSPVDISVRSKGLHSNFERTLFSTTGQRDLVECSNRGTCDRSTGICACYPGFTSSNGLGGNGTINDCGYQYATSFTYTSSDGLSTFTTTCPVDEDNQVCSGHGTCNGAGICTCEDGYSKFIPSSSIPSAHCLPCPVASPRLCCCLQAARPARSSAAAVPSRGSAT